MKFTIVLLTLMSHFQSVESHCEYLTTCFACTQRGKWCSAQCQWCPLTHMCQSKLSLKNECLQEQNLRNPEQCVIYGKTKQYSPSEALHLAQFAAISYSDVPGQCMARIFPKDDYIIEKTLLKECDDYYFDYEKKCTAIIAKSDNHREIVVAIRGSNEENQVLDQICTFIEKYKVPFPTGGKVQEYFMNVNNKLYPDIKGTLYDLLKTHPGYEVKVTGHSLGGTVASLTSALLIHDKIVKHDQLLLYTFGMPRVGNKAFAFNHDRIVRNSWRVVRALDFVAELPMCILGNCSSINIPYHHGTKVLYTGSEMNVNSKYMYNICKGNEESNYKCGNRRGSLVPIYEHFEKQHVEYFGFRVGHYCSDQIIKNSE